MSNEQHIIWENDYYYSNWTNYVRTRNKSKTAKPHNFLQWIFHFPPFQSLRTQFIFVFVVFSTFAFVLLDRRRFLFGVIILCGVERETYFWWINSCETEMMWKENENYSIDYCCYWCVRAVNMRKCLCRLWLHFVSHNPRRDLKTQTIWNMKSVRADHVMMQLFWCKICWRLSVLCTRSHLDSSIVCDRQLISILCWIHSFASATTTWKSESLRQLEAFVIIYRNHLRSLQPTDTENKNVHFTYSSPFVSRCQSQSPNTHSAGCYF